MGKEVANVLKLYLTNYKKDGVSNLPNHVIEKLLNPWVSVDEDFPDEYKTVLGFKEPDSMYIGYFQFYDDGSKTFVATEVDDLEYIGGVQIDYWAPLLDPPKKCGVFSKSDD